MDKNYYFQSPQLTRAQPQFQIPSPPLPLEYNLQCHPGHCIHQHHVTLRLPNGQPELSPPYLQPYRHHYALDKQRELGKLTYHVVSPSPTPDENPKPGFFVTQPLTSRLVLQKIPDVSLSPPQQQGPFIPLSVRQQPRILKDEDGSPYFYVNIPVAMESSPSYLISIPVPVSEFALIPQNILQESRSEADQLFLSQHLNKESSTTSSPEPINRNEYSHQYNVGDISYSSQDDRSLKNYATSDNETVRKNNKASSCKLCVSNKETASFSNNHVLHDENGVVRCPVLRKHVCKVCLATGDNAHTLKYCPVRMQLIEDGSESESEKRPYNRHSTTKRHSDSSS